MLETCTSQQRFQTLSTINFKFQVVFWNYKSKNCLKKKNKWKSYLLPTFLDICSKLNLKFFFLQIRAVQISSESSKKKTYPLDKHGILIVASTQPSANLPMYFLN